MNLADPSPSIRVPRMTSVRPRDGWWPRLSMGLVLQALRPMARGTLEMTLPDGSTERFGGAQPGPAASLSVRRQDFFRRCVLHGDIGFGEAYVAGDWETDDLTAVIAWFCANAASVPGMSGSRRRDWRLNLFGRLNRMRHLRRANSPANSRLNIREHYDLGNEFYRLWLDPSMTYSSALFEREEQDLASAQSAKYERLCRALRLKPGCHVLEIGCGWGGFARHAVAQHGCRYTGVTLSQEQLTYARELAGRERWADRADFRLQDYRHLEGRFDRIVSIEMLEAVGDEYLEAFFGQVQQLLSPEGLFAAQFITCPDARYSELRSGVDWIQKHIFPGSLLLSLNRVNEAIRRTGPLWLHDLHDLGHDYARTLREWRGSFNREREAIHRLGFDDAFVRKWNYYLSYCEAAFATRNISVVQALWTHPNNPELGTTY